MNRRTVVLKSSVLAEEFICGRFEDVAKDICLILRAHIFFNSYKIYISSIVNRPPYHYQSTSLNPPRLHLNFVYGASSITYRLSRLN